MNLHLDPPGIGFGQQRLGKVLVYLPGPVILSGSVADLMTDLLRINTIVDSNVVTVLVSTIMLTQTNDNVDTLV